MIKEMGMNCLIASSGKEFDGSDYVLPVKTEIILRRSVEIVSHFLHIKYVDCNILVMVSKDLHEKKGSFGTCKFSHDKDNLITIHLNLLELNFTIETLCHELVHGKQYLFDGLKIFPGMVQFKNNFYACDDFDRSNQNHPWEREPYCKQKTLYNEIIFSMNNSEIDYLRECWNKSERNYL